MCPTLHEAPHSQWPSLQFCAALTAHPWGCSPPAAVFPRRADQSMWLIKPEDTHTHFWISIWKDHTSFWTEQERTEQTFHLNQCSLTQMPDFDNPTLVVQCNKQRTTGCSAVQPACLVKSSILQILYLNVRILIHRIYRKLRQSSSATHFCQARWWRNYQPLFNDCSQKCSKHWVLLGSPLGALLVQALIWPQHSFVLLQIVQRYWGTEGRSTWVAAEDAQQLFVPVVCTSLVPTQAAARRWRLSSISLSSGNNSRNPSPCYSSQIFVKCLSQQHLILALQSIISS